MSAVKNAPAAAPATVSRRTTLKWFGSIMLASAATACGPEQTTPEEDYAARMARSGSPLGTPRPVSGPTYGYDPDSVDPTVPWNMTMTDEQLRLAASLSDMILPADDVSPAASTVGVPAYIDEWVSAPYERQQRDRELFFEGFTWLEETARDRFDAGFADLDDAQRGDILDEIAWRDRASEAPRRMRNFFSEFRVLAISAFYATQEGMADIGYLGNRPIIGKYPGPSAEALEHLKGVLENIGLDMPPTE